LANCFSLRGDAARFVDQFRVLRDVQGVGCHQEVPWKMTNNWHGVAFFAASDGVGGFAPSEVLIVPAYVSEALSFAITDLIHDALLARLTEAGFIRDTAEILACEAACDAEAQLNVIAKQGFARSLFEQYARECG
jgi:hypothetical protein